MIVLAIDPDDLLTALRERSPQISSRLDLDTGEIYQISALFADDEIEDDPGFVLALRTTPERFVPLPAFPPELAYQTMTEFVADVPDAALRAALISAMSKQRAFFHFRDTLAGWPAQDAQWQQRISQLMLQWVDEWLRQRGIQRQ